MTPEDDELIAHIKESLKVHEEVYTPGSWERFEKSERKGRRLLWPVISLSSAAALLLIGFVFLYTERKTAGNAVKDYAKVKEIKKDIDTLQVLPGQKEQQPSSRSITENLKTAVAENGAVVAQRTNNKIVNSPLIVATQYPEASKAIVVAKDQPTVSVDQPPVRASQNERVKTTDSGLIVQTPVKTKEVYNFQDFLNAEVNANPALARTKSTRKNNEKWEMGLVVAPSIGNSKRLNMGYGVSMAYSLSDKVSVSSGISYSEMAASKSMLSSGADMPNSPGGAASMVKETKSLQSVDANVVGLDIPLEIKYYITKKIYTNVGVSAFAVLSQKQNNNYLQGAVADAPVNDANIAGFKTVFQQTLVSEQVPSGEVRDDKYLGFYNISFGYKQKISEKRSFSIEPFMKLPIKEATKENLHLIGTGVKLKFDF